jgi:hypothetical protein
MKNIMSTEKIERIFLEKFEPTDQQLILDYSKVFIPFSENSVFTKTEYIYFGNESIPFKERHPEYQELFIHEFLTANLVNCFS